MVDLNPIKIFLSLAAIYFACMTSVASGVPNISTYDPAFGSQLDGDLKSCPVPFTAEYCNRGTGGKCGTESFWPQVLYKYSWQNTVSRSICPHTNASKNQKSES